MRSQSLCVMGQLTLRWNLMKNVKLKGGNFISCCVLFQCLFAEGQFMFQCALHTCHFNFFIVQSNVYF